MRMLPYVPRMLASTVTAGARPDKGQLPLKLLISFTASGRDTGKCMMHNDVSRAYFHAPAIRNVFVDIAPEDRELVDEAKCGWLNKSMYGTKDAGSNCEELLIG